MSRKLFEPGRIGALTVKNRSVMPPMQMLYGELDGSVGMRTLRYYEERAKGGVGLIIVEATAVDEINNTPWNYQLRLTADKYISGFQRLAEAIHRYDCLAFIQLHHYGSKSAPTAAGPGWTSSEIPAVPGGKPGHKMTVEEIGIMQQRFVDAAVRAKKAGFDGVELAGTHGYLLHQFLSPYYNDRTDEYGGSTENRCRFYTELIEKIHAACGSRFPVSVRFPGDEFTHHIPKTLTVEDGVEIAKILEKAGADVLNVSNGNNFNADANCEPYSYRFGWKAYVSKAVKDAVSIPVIATGTIKSPEEAEQHLENGNSDFVCLGRSLFADPDFMKKAAAGNSLAIRKCMGCMYCREQLYSVMPVMCAFNPRCGCEYLYPAIPAKDLCGKKAVVAGGGPAGMEAAKTLAERGGSVVLFEAKDKLGGSLNLADKGVYKERITFAVDTMADELKNLGVDVRLNTKADIAAVKAENPDLAVLACGASPIIPNVPGVEAVSLTDGASAKTSNADNACAKASNADSAFAKISNVYLAEEIISGKTKLSGSVAVIGAGMVGLECAEALALAGCKVKIVEMQEKAGNGIFSVIAADMMSRINQHAPEMYLGCALKEITANGVKVHDLKAQSSVDPCGDNSCGVDQCDKEIPADHVVLALGVKADTALADEFRKEFPNCLILGDARQAARMPHAIRDAYIKAVSVEV